MLNLLWEMGPCLIGGAFIGRWRPQWIAPLATPLVRFGVPVSLMGLLLHGGLNGSLLGMAMVAVTVIAVMLTLLRLATPFSVALTHPELQLGSCIGNTAYFGIPAALALLPSDALPISIGYDFGATLLAWGLGPLWLTRKPASSGPDRRWRNLLGHLSASPASRGLIGALIVMVTPWHLAISDALWLPSRAVIVLALAVVGMRLGSIASKNAPSLDVSLTTPLICKLLLFPALMLLISLALPLPGVARQALVLQAAAPTAISVLLMAESEHVNVAAPAQLILRSTVLALISVPLWSLLIRPLGGTPGM